MVQSQFFVMLDAVNLGGDGNKFALNHCSNNRLSGRRHGLYQAGLSRAQRITQRSCQGSRDGRRPQACEGHALALTARTTVSNTATPLSDSNRSVSLVSGARRQHTAGGNRPSQPADVAQVVEALGRLRGLSANDEAKLVRGNLRALLS